MLKCLAIGGFSKVYLARSLQTGQFLAAKFIDKTKVPSNDKKQLILNQKKVNQIADYTFLVKMHQFIQTDNFYILIMDYCPGGELFYLLRSIKRMSENQARIYFIQVLLGIQYLHKKGIMYRDLKPQNIMIDQSGHIKIADFGLAKFYKQKSYSFCGSIEYMSPQIVTNAGHSFQVDFYCMGALLYELLIGCPPFYNPEISQYETKKHIAYSQVEFPEDFGLSDQVKDLIEKLLVKNPSQRLGHYGGAKQIMLHPWLGKINRGTIESKQLNVPFKPNLNIFNFDSSQIGLSQERFTNKIKNQYKLLQYQQYSLYKVKNKSSYQKMSSSKKYKKNSMDSNIKLSLNSRDKSYSPYRQYSNSCKKIQNSNSCYLQNKNKKASLQIVNPFRKLKNIIKEDMNNITQIKILTKNKSPSFGSLEKKRSTLSNKKINLHFYKKYKTINTQFNEQSINKNNNNNNDLVKKLYKKTKNFTEQSQPSSFEFQQLTNKMNNQKIYQNTNSLAMKYSPYIQFLQSNQSFKGKSSIQHQKNNLTKQLKKSSNLKMKNFYNNARISTENQDQLFNKQNGNMANNYHINLNLRMKINIDNKNNK